MVMPRQRLNLSTFGSEMEPRQSYSHARPTAPSYSVYGAQRVIGRPLRHNPRLGASDNLRPDPARSTASLKSEWEGSSVVLSNGQWGYTGQNVTLTVIEVGGPDGNAYVITRPSIPTATYPGGQSFWQMQSVAADGEWHRPGVFAKVARSIGVKSGLLLGALALVGMRLARDTRLFRNNPARYSKRGYVLCTCNECGARNYVEPHGTTARCKKCKRRTEHSNIPYSRGDAWVE